VNRVHEIVLSHAELVSLYLALTKLEPDLDETQKQVLERLAATLYTELSVSEMEEIDKYYRELGPLR